MSAMTSFTRRSLAKNRVRTGVTIAGVALAAALLAAVLASVNSLSAYLLNAEIADNGPWTASVWTSDAQAVKHAEESEHVEAAAALRDVGFAALSAETQQRYGHYLAVRSIEGDIAEMCAVSASEGRMPKDASEIMLPSTWKGSEEFDGAPLEVGSTVTLDLGQRITVASDANESPSDLAGYAVDDDSYLDGREIEPLHAGETLNSGDSYREAVTDGGAFNETLEDAEERTYTVVGFYETRNIATSTAVGYAALTAGDQSTGGRSAGGDQGAGGQSAGGDQGARGDQGTGGQSAGGQSAGDNQSTRGQSTDGETKVYLITTGLSTQKQIGDAMRALFPDADVSYHNALLRYAGITDDRAIWDTFYNLAAVLAIVIVVACVSLIYNAFAISVAERTRQFGLLASIGASRKQLRGAVIYEALIVALTGVPLGLLAGLGGTAAVLAAIGPALEELMGKREDVTFQLAVEPASVAFAAALTLVTVLVSAWVPALRAGSVSAIDAIHRTRDVRPATERAGLARVRKGAGAGTEAEEEAAAVTAVGADATAGADAGSGAPASTSTSTAANTSTPANASATNTNAVWKARGFGLHRLFGVPGQIARANRKRGHGAGRAASVSLALAIVLLMTAGSLSTYLGILTDAAGGEQTLGDVRVSIYSSSEQASLKALDSLKQKYDEIYQALVQADGAQAIGYDISTSVPVIIPKDMCAHIDESPEGYTSLVSQDDDTYAGFLQVSFIPDEDFRAYAREAGVDPNQFFDGTPRAIAIGSTYVNDSTTYAYHEFFSNAGTVKRIVAGSFDGMPMSFLSFFYETQEVEGQEVEVAKVTGVGDYVQDASGKTERTFNEPLSNIDLTCANIEVVTVSDLQPASLYVYTPTLILPQSAYGAFFSANEDAQDPLRVYPGMTALFNAADHAATASELSSIAEQICGESEGTLGSAGALEFYVADSAADYESMKMLITIINVFSLLFTGILMLIAMANVFNTVTNGLILRRREFAVMRSVGMGTRAFRRMIACECLGYSVRGLLPGVVVAVGVSYLLYQAMGSSVKGLAFTLPWAAMAAALAFTCVVMAVSVAYGMRRCKASNVVEALRMDAA